MRSQIFTIYIKKKDVALNSQQQLIYHKPNQTKSLTGAVECTNYFSAEG